MSILRFAGYTIEHDGTCWTLHEGRKKRGGRVKTRVINPSYHGSLEQVARELVDREAAKASKHVASLSQLTNMVRGKLEIANVEQLIDGMTTPD